MNRRSVHRTLRHYLKGKLAMTKPDPILFLDDSCGVYIPRDFAEEIDRGCVHGVDAETWAVLEAGPDHPEYWDAWTDVTEYAIVTDPTTGAEYRVVHDGDCWLIPVLMAWNDKTEQYEYPNDEDGEESA
jgi:hypothetical protein